MSGRWLHGIKRAMSVGPERNAAARNQGIALVEVAFSRLRSEVHVLSWIVSNCVQKCTELSKLVTYVASFGKRLYAASDIPATAVFEKAAVLSAELEASATAAAEALRPVEAEVADLAIRLEALEALRATWVRAVTDDIYYRIKMGKMAAASTPSVDKVAERLARNELKSANSHAELQDMTEKFQSEFLAVFRERISVADRVFKAVFTTISKTAKLADFREVETLLNDAQFGERNVLLSDADVRDIQSISGATQALAAGPRSTQRPPVGKTDAKPSFSGMLRRKSTSATQVEATGQFGNPNPHVQSAGIVAGQGQSWGYRVPLLPGSKHPPEADPSSPVSAQVPDLDRRFDRMHVAQTVNNAIAHGNSPLSQGQNSFMQKPPLPPGQNTPVPYFPPGATPQSHFDPYPSNLSVPLQSTPQQHVPLSNKKPYSGDLYQSSGWQARPEEHREPSAPPLSNQFSATSALTDDAISREACRFDPQESAQPLPLPHDEVSDQNAHHEWKRSLPSEIGFSDTSAIKEWALLHRLSNEPSRDPAVNWNQQQVEGSPAPGAPHILFPLTPPSDKFSILKTGSPKTGNEDTK